MKTIIISILGLGVIGLVAGLILGYTNQKFYRKVDPRIEEIDEALPGANCGACGYPGCRGFSEAVVAGKADVKGCLLGGEQTTCKISKIMGIEANKKKEKIVAILKCGGGKEQSPSKFDYQGVQTCQAAQTIGGGFKACTYGCLGLGDCVIVCPVDCIKMDENGLPQVEYEKCIACGKCLKACPRTLFTLLPISTKYHVNCSSKDKGAIARKACKIACIGCGICVKKCPSEAITMKDFLAKINPKKCTKSGKCIKACPTKCIIQM
ncbi:MAG: RnfABCDGE type electron transport complex subunit B [Candidatus Saganbacteria bacterium]|nr:RnfABCDGE type electron transport complex subunit B [Candidatus Saganbacteria bacterium]